MLLSAPSEREETAEIGAACTNNTNHLLDAKEDSCLYTFLLLCVFLSPTRFLLYLYPSRSIRYLITRSASSLSVLCVCVCGLSSSSFVSFSIHLTPDSLSLTEASQREQGGAGVCAK